MKIKYFFATIAAVCTLALTSCNGEETVTPLPDRTPAAAFMDFAIDFDTVTVQVYDISFDYLDEKGVKKNIVVDRRHIGLYVKTASLPAKLGFHMNIALREGVDYSECHDFTVGYIWAVNFQCTNKAGEPIGKKVHHEGMPHMGLTSIEAVNIYFEHLAENPFEYVYQFDENGDIKEAKMD